VDEHDSIEAQPPTKLPQPGSLELETAMLPRDAFFGRVEQVPAEQASGRIGAETISPYPPGVPVITPGEVINDDVVAYLTSGVEPGMLVPDAADPSMRTVRVVAAP
jgi:arginine decarboxylase